MGHTGACGRQAGCAMMCSSYVARIAPAGGIVQVTGRTCLRGEMGAGGGATRPRRRPEKGSCGPGDALRRALAVIRRGATLLK